MKRIAALGALLLSLAACGGGTAVGDIEVGACFDDPDSETVSQLQIIDCAQPHDNEVYAKALLTDSLWPGTAAIEEFSIDACLAEFETYVGQTYAESPLDYFFLSPTEEGFNQGDITVLCVLYSADLEKLEGSQAASP